MSQEEKNELENSSDFYAEIDMSLGFKVKITNEEYLKMPNDSLTKIIWIESSFIEDCRKIQNSNSEENSKEFMALLNENVLYHLKDNEKIKIGIYSVYTVPNIDLWKVCKPE
jgi:hypothetical protein